MKKIILRILMVVFTTVLFAVFGLITVLMIVNYGPSDRAHKLFVNSVRETSAIGFLADWFKNFLLMAGGVLLIVLIEYIPFFAGIGPGADLLFSPTFGGPFMSILILFVPQVAFFSISCTYLYRRTGNVYTGAFTAAMLACWIVTGGSSFL